MLTSDFKEFAESLNSNSVEYLVVGSYALAAYGHPGYTGDLDGVSLADCYPRRMTVAVDGVALNFISLEDFKTNKKAVGRHRDVADLEALEGLPPPQPSPGGGGSNS